MSFHFTFIPPTPLRQTLVTHTPQICCPPRRARHQPMHASLLPSKSDSIAQLKERSVITLRGLSDLAGLSLTHEICCRFVLLPNANMALIADSELLLGGLMGVWTAAVFAERLRQNTAALISESEELPSRWDSNVLHSPALDEDDLQHAVAWLYALDELEGLAAAHLLRSVAASPHSSMRLRLAQALGAFPLRSNVTLPLLTTLATDRNRVVRDAARASLDAYEEARIVLQVDAQSAAVSPTALHSLGAGLVHPHHDDLDNDLDPDDEMALRALLERLVMEPPPVTVPALYVCDAALSWRGYDARWLRDVVTHYVGSMRNAALTQPELPELDLAWHALLGAAPAPATVDECGTTDTQQVDDGDMAFLKSAAPLVDSLRLSEIHGICALALVPALYELFAVIDGESLPLRFVGLGWLLALGGLVAYPKSATIWYSFRKMIERMQGDH